MKTRAKIRTKWAIQVYKKPRTIPSSTDFLHKKFSWARTHITSHIKFSIWLHMRNT